MKMVNMLFIVGAILCFSSAEGAFEKISPIQIDKISELLEKNSYHSQEIKNYDLTEIYIAGALLMEGWGCNRDEKKALQLYLSVLQELSEHPLNLDVLLKDEDDIFEKLTRLPQGEFNNVFREEYDKSRRPFVLYAMIGDTIRLLLQQGLYEEAVHLMHESRQMSMLKGKGMGTEGGVSNSQASMSAKDEAHIVNYYESMLYESIEEGYLYILALFNRKSESVDNLSQALRLGSHNKLIEKTVLQGFEQKTEREKLKAFPFVLRSARLGIPQAMFAMHLYYRDGCGSLPPDKKSSEDWLKAACNMAPTSNESSVKY